MIYDIFNIILKYLIKCHKCNKYNSKKYIDYCDKCNYYYSTMKIYFCKECSKIELYDNIDHCFWVCLCKKCLDGESQNCVWI